MTTIIVPTDFSQVADNAARYAAKMLKGHYGASMILYHICEKAGEAEEAGKLLERLRTELQASSPVKIESRLETGGDVIDCLENLARHLNAGLIVMGITGKSRLEKVFLGSNTLK